MIRWLGAALLLMAHPPWAWGRQPASGVVFGIFRA